MPMRPFILNIYSEQGCVVVIVRGNNSEPYHVGTFVRSKMSELDRVGRIVIRNLTDRSCVEEIVRRNYSKPTHFIIFVRRT